MKPKKPNKLQHGVLLSVFWLARHHGMPRMAAHLAKDHGCADLDVSGFDDFEQEIFKHLNDHEATHFVLSNDLGVPPLGRSGTQKTQQS